MTNQLENRINRYQRPLYKKKIHLVTKLKRLFLNRLNSKMNKKGKTMLNLTILLGL